MALAQIPEGIAGPGHGRNGAELGMPVGPDAANRGPMSRELVHDNSPDLKWMRSLIALHQAKRALLVGAFRECSP